MQQKATNKYFILSILLLILTIITLTKCSTIINKPKDNNIITHLADDKKKILFTVISPSLESVSYGSFTRNIAIAQEAKRLGHEIAFLCGQHWKESLIKHLKRAFPHDYKTITIYTLKTRPKVFSFIPNEWFMEPKDVKVPSFILDKKTKRFGSLYMAWMLMGFGNESIVKKIVLEQLEIYLKFKPNVLFLEIDLPTYISASLIDIPIMETISSPMLEGKDSFFSFWLNSMTKSIVSDFSVKDKSFSALQYLDGMRYQGKSLKIVPSIEALETEEIIYMPNVTFVGHLFPNTSNSDFDDTNIEKTKSDYKYQNQKVIFAYFGKGSVPTEIVEQVMSNFCLEINKRNNDNISYHCYIAENSIKNSYTLLNYTHFENYIDGNEIMKISTLVFTHGGSNTVHQSLYYGVPLITYAGGFFERTFNGLMVARNKAGAFIEYDGFNVDNLLKIWEEASKDGVALKEWKENAVRLSIKLKEKEGAKQVLNDMGMWLVGRKEVDYSYLENELIPNVRKVLEKESEWGMMEVFLRDVGYLVSFILSLVLMVCVLNVVCIVFYCKQKRN